MPCDIPVEIARPGLEGAVHAATDGEGVRSTTGIDDHPDEFDVVARSAGVVEVSAELTGSVRV
ncbi:Uncharacterised protein [Mycobacteroides abscessus subsp. abscessus]|nr:Uncharacterised protein [Mycobacteroides abscessus subsp. abscessus]